MSYNITIQYKDQNIQTNSYSVLFRVDWILIYINCRLIGISKEGV